MWKWLTLIVVMLWLGTGCYVPLKQTSPGFRSYFPATLEDFHVGSHTRSDVLLIMGEPDEFSSDETIFIYRWSEVRGVFVITQCTPGMEVKKETSYTFAFDEDGLLENVKVDYGDF